MSDSGSTLAIVSLVGLLLNSVASGVLSSAEGVLGGGGAVSGLAVGSDDPGSGDTRQPLIRPTLNNAKKTTMVTVRFTANVSLVLLIRQPIE